MPSKSKLEPGQAIAGLHRPTIKDFRAMVEGETRVFTFEDARSMPRAATFQSQIGGNFATSKLLLLDSKEETVVSVMLVTCLEPSPLPPAKARRRKAEIAALKQRLAELQPET